MRIAFSETATGRYGEEARLDNIVGTPFVGRLPELRRLEESRAEVVAGRSVTWAIGGHAGVGKSRLVRELLARAEADGAIGLVGGCVDLADGGLPLWPFVEALRGYTSTLSEVERAQLAGPGGDELTRILPELSTGVPPPRPAAGASAQGRLFELLLGLLGRLAARAPLVLVVEDIHWAGRSTRDLLKFLSKTLRAERIMLIATHRSDELYRGHPLRPYLAELYRARDVNLLELRPFTRDEQSQQLFAITGAHLAPAVVDSVYARSEGNAFYAEELVAAAGENKGAELPTTLSDILLSRVDNRPPAVQEVLRIAAVGGRSVPVALLAEVCPLPASELTAALREAVAHHLLVVEGDSAYAFSHALLREAIYQELLPGERGALHRRYGVALSEQPQLGGDVASMPGELAHHWFAAHELPQALGASVFAGRVAESRWGFAEAGAHYERALELFDSVADAERSAGVDHLTLSRSAAEAANLAGDHVRAGTLIRAAIERAGPQRSGLLWERLGRYLWAAGDSESALGAYGEALRLVPEQPPSPARARVLAAHGQSLMLMARFGEACGCCEQAIEIAREVGARAEEGHALNTLGCSLAYVGDPAGAVDHLREALVIADEVGDLDDLGRAYQNLSEILGGPLNRLGEALKLALEGDRVTQRVGLARDYGVSLEVNAASALLSLGRWDEAAAILRDAEERRPVDMAAIEVHLCRARLEVARGAFEQGTRHIEAARRVMGSILDPQFQASLCARRAELWMWQHSPAEGRRAVDDGLASLEGSDDAWFVGPLLWLGAWARTDSGCAAPELMQRAGALVGASTTDAFVSPVTVAYARTCLAEGERLADPAATAGWRAAAEAWEAAAHPYPLAYARWREAEALLARRRAREATAPLRSAHAIAEQLGADPLRREIELLADRARIDLSAAQAPAPGDAPAGDGAAGHNLTKRERQVLELVATGRTNREIAQTLFVTEKTAAAHVSNILAKLGVRGRVEAATAAHRLGLLAQR